jgi:hypothetical protein
MRYVPSDYEEWLNRIGVHPQDYDNISSFQAAVRASTESGSLTRGQLNALSTYYSEEVTAPAIYAAARVTYEYAGKTFIRYTIPGQRGLFGWTKFTAWLQS